MAYDFLTAFVLGLLTPLTAVCVLPLYPAFIAYLSNQTSKGGKKASILKITSLIVLGILIFMLILGLLFTTLLQTSLTKVIGIVSPIAFIILLIISLFLIFNVDFGRILPKAKAPVLKNPYSNAFVYGFFFGAIIIPCNPAFLAALFARSLLVMGFFENILNFLFFGIGIGAPLLLFSIISVKYSNKIIKYLTSKKKIINLVAGIIMLVISLYYLIFVFNILRV